MHGYDVKILDFFADPIKKEQYKKILEEFNPDVIGYSVYTRTVPFLRRMVELLLLLIWAMDYLFSLCFKKSDLGISEKKRYIFMAYVGACISGFIIASRDASKLALEIPNITISVLIGAYVPFTLLLEDGKKGKVELQSMKEEWEEKYKKTFRERKAKDILSVLLFAMVYGVLLGVALSPAQNIINDIASGIGMGMATVVVAFVGLVEVKNRLTKRKNKREDADQEKSGTE